MQCGLVVVVIFQYYVAHVDPISRGMSFAKIVCAV